MKFDKNFKLRPNDILELSKLMATHGLETVIEMMGASDFHIEDWTYMRQVRDALIVFRNIGEQLEIIASTGNSVLERKQIKALIKREIKAVAGKHKKEVNNGKITMVECILSDHVFLAFHEQFEPARGKTQTTRVRRYEELSACLIGSYDPSYFTESPYSDADPN